MVKKIKNKPVYSKKIRNLIFLNLVNKIKIKPLLF